MKNVRNSALAITTALMLSGCSAFYIPYQEPKFQDIASNQTAFLVPLTGANKADQGKFMSEDYLNDNKIATKKVTIPRIWVQTGYSHLGGLIPGDGFYQDTARVITVDRTPVTREWTNGETGTDTKNQAIYVESKESIDFFTGIVVSALVKEEDAAKFLYWYSGKTLDDIMDSNVRGMVQSILAAEFGKRNLDDCRNDKAAIILATFNEVRDAFAGKGITITNIGNSGGLTYADPNIQAAINNAFVAQNNKSVAIANRQAQDETNQNTINIAKAAAQAQSDSQRIYNQTAIDMAKANSFVAEEFNRTLDARRAKADTEIRLTQANAMLELAKNSHGLPASILPAGSPLLLGLDKEK